MYLEGIFGAHFDAGVTASAEVLHGRCDEVFVGFNALLAVRRVEGKDCFGADFEAFGTILWSSAVLGFPLECELVLHFYHQSLRAGTDSRGRSSMARSGQVSLHNPQPQHFHMSMWARPVRVTYWMAPNWQRERQV